MPVIPETLPAKAILKEKTFGMEKPPRIKTSAR
jgi:hypothetical protein